MHPNGNLRWFRGTFGRLEERQTGYIGTIVSLEEDRQLEQRLEKSSSKFRSIFMNAQGGIVLSNSSLHVIAANRAFAKMLGFENDSSIRGAFLPSLKYSEDRPRENELLNHIC